MQLDSRINQAGSISIPEVKDFVTHFRGLLTDRPFIHTHSGTEWQCRSLKEALDSYSWPRGKHAKNFEETNALLKELAQELKFATKKEKNEKNALRACIGILEWGGVRNGAHGVVKIYLEDTYGGHPLIESISGAVEVLTADKVDLTNFSSSKRLENDENETIQLDQSDMIVEPRNSSLHYRMNASFTKIYALLSDKRPFLIYDSRVAAALGLIVKRYWQGKNIQSTLPNCLCFSYLEGRAGKEIVRNASDKSGNQIKFVKIGNDRDHALWNIRANWIIEEAIRGTSFAGLLNEFEQMRAVEAALFMIGYNVNEI